MYLIKVMINRVLIRLKIVQIVYAYYQNGNKNLDNAEKELFFSLSKAYDLYNYLLLLMIELTNFAQKRIDAAKNKLVPSQEDLAPCTKFVENKFIAQLEVNKQLVDFVSNQKRTCHIILSISLCHPRPEVLPFRAVLSLSLWALSCRAAPAP